MDLRVICSFCLFLIVLAEDEEDTYSYYKFRGPVSGQIRSIQVGPSKFDYVARPDYAYSYGVQDPKTGNSQTHLESRDGDSVHGEYRVLQADGLVRIVRYTADPKNGFQAVVEYAPYPA